MRVKANDTSDFDTTCINTIRTLSMGAVQAVSSGHPGTPMAMAPVAYCLRRKFLRFSVGTRSFGESALLKDLTKKFAFTPEHIVAAARAQLGLPAATAGDHEYMVPGGPT